jgi:hypothetical protein
MGKDYINMCGDRKWSGPFQLVEPSQVSRKKCPQHQEMNKFQILYTEDPRMVATAHLIGRDMLTKNRNMFPISKHLLSKVFYSPTSKKSWILVPANRHTKSPFQLSI